MTTHRCNRIEIIRLHEEGGMELRLSDRDAGGKFRVQKSLKVLGLSAKDPAIFGTSDKGLTMIMYSRCIDVTVNNGLAHCEGVREVI